MGADGIFDDRVAPTYDQHHAERFAPEVLGPTIDVLAELADGQPALELAIGTGRVALPLRERGVEVTGIDISEAMLRELQAKPGADRIPVVVGDMATTAIAGRFGLVYLVFNTIGNLLTQDEQVACFENAAAHLLPGGHFVVEVTVPSLRRLPPGETLVAYEVTEHHIGVDEIDVANQLSVSHHAWAGAEGTEFFRTPQRFAWPAEYDLMARIAGLELRDRWGDWDRSPYTSESTAHVSVWSKPGGPT